MSNTPKWKIFREGEYVGACKYAEDAAAFAALVRGSVVKYDHRVLVWTEGAEAFPAGESYDRAAEIMHARRDEYYSASRKRIEASAAAFKKRFGQPQTAYIER